MKKLISILFVSLLILSCGSDDNNDTNTDNNNPEEPETDVPQSAIIRIASVNTDTDTVTLTNLGNTSIDIGSYFLCLGPGTYKQISDITTENTTLTNTATISLSYDVNPDTDGLSIFSSNAFSSSEPEVLIDYVQWGSGNQARVDQAVTAGRWDAVDNFVPLATSYTFTGTSNEIGVQFW